MDRFKPTYFRPKLTTPAGRGIAWLDYKPNYLQPELTLNGSGPVESFDPLQQEEEPRSMLPRSIDAFGQPATSAILLQRAIDALEEQPDMTALQEFARQRGEEGKRDMLRALAAQYAGERFEPVQANFLKRAMAAQEPLEVGDYGYITSDGQYVENPLRRQEETIKTALEAAKLSEKGDQGLVRFGDYGYITPDGQFVEDPYSTRNKQVDTLIDAANVAERSERAAAEQAAEQADRDEEKRSKRDLDQIYHPSGFEKNPLIITPNVDYSLAFGATGAWRKAVNVTADAVGLADAENEHRIATENMEALRKNTQLTLQAAVPGRPSNYLLGKLDEHTVTPNTLTMGVAGAQARAQATIAVIDTGLKELTLILNNRNSKDNDFDEALKKYDALSQLKAEYIALVTNLRESQSNENSSNEGVADDVERLIQQYTATGQN